MSNILVETIISNDEGVRNKPVDLILNGRNKSELTELAEGIEAFRRSSGNLYHKVRASLFLWVIYRYYLQFHKEVLQHGTIPFDGIQSAYDRDFERAIDLYSDEIKNRGRLNGALCSAMADAYYNVAFKYLLEQVKLSISHCSGNHLLFNINGLKDYPYSVPEELTVPDSLSGFYPVGMDASPVRLDPSHSGWSDIFFLGMDFPEGARVINMSVDLKIHGSNDLVLPPCECYCRYIEEPVISLISIDLKTSKKVASLNDIFNFGNDYLSLLKAGVVASGIVPPCFENKDIPLQDLLYKLLGKKGGIEIVTRVNGIPKGSRLAVSTTLLATVVARLMRFSGQITNRAGTLTEEERRIVASRAILGEWLGGSGGGWQDSGGLWPGIKVITGKQADECDPEFGVSRGCLLPEHNVLTEADISIDTEQKIIDSMVIVHGGISQDVGPILEMVTGKYLLKYQKEWDARLNGIRLFDKIADALKAGDMEYLGRLTTEDWEDSLQQVIPWVSNAFTEDLINRVRGEYGEKYYGFLMLGGMSGGGMAFIVEPSVREEFKKRISVIMCELKETYSASLPFIIDPVVYDFRINHEGIVARFFTGKDAVIPQIETETPPLARADNDGLSEDDIKSRYGFDSVSHEHIKSLLKTGEIGLAMNRLPLTTRIDDVAYDEIFHYENEDIVAVDSSARKDLYKTGVNSLQNNEIAVVTFAGGMGSRWTHGSEVVKAINPFIKIDGRYRTFIEMHLAKSRMTGDLWGNSIAHVFTTSYLTHNAILGYLEKFNHFNYKGRLYFSPARSISRRVYPMERDLRFYWMEQLQQKLDENVQKVQDNVRGALIEWARGKGESEDYSENRPLMRFNPPGHWYEIPNLIKNGTLAKMLRDNPSLKYLLCHNIDTIGASVDPVLLGLHIAGRSCLTFEVTPRRFEDRGGGLAKVNGHIQLIEGMALPREEDEYKLSCYNTLTNWISIDSLLACFGADREMVLQAEHDAGKYNRVLEGLREIEKKMPTYVTLKEVKQVWGNGQEDVYPVAQFEKLWGDMTWLKDLEVNYAGVSRFRGQQLKEPAFLDTWANDGSLDYVKRKVIF